MIKYTIDLGKYLEYYRWEDMDLIMYDIKTYKIEAETFDDHLLTIF